MAPSKQIALHAIATAVLFELSLIRLSIATSRVYQPSFGDSPSPRLNLAVAAVFRLFYVVGIPAPAVIPGVREGAVAVTGFAAGRRLGLEG
jgi:uncharacterized membrane protein